MEADKSPVCGAGRQAGDPQTWYCSMGPKAGRILSLGGGQSLLCEGLRSMEWGPPALWRVTCYIIVYWLKWLSLLKNVFTGTSGILLGQKSGYHSLAKLAANASQYSALNRIQHCEGLSCCSHGHTGPLPAAQESLRVPAILAVQVASCHTQGWHHGRAPWVSRLSHRALCLKLVYTIFTVVHLPSWNSYLWTKGPRFIFYYFYLFLGAHVLIWKWAAQVSRGHAVGRCVCTRSAVSPLDTGPRAGCWESHQEQQMQSHKELAADCTGPSHLPRGGGNVLGLP